ncbi:MAG: hypothetical protein LAT82_05750 [Nanoarchaeota archaeon]|nr:hypothetical protein [Nanoarchaeota archaeon]
MVRKIGIGNLEKILPFIDVGRVELPFIDVGKVELPFIDTNRMVLDDYRRQRKTERDNLLFIGKDGQDYRTYEALAAANSEYKRIMYAPKIDYLLHPNPLPSNIYK